MRPNTLCKKGLQSDRSLQVADSGLYRAWIVNEMLALQKYRKHKASVLKVRNKMLKNQQSFSRKIT